MSGIYNKQIGFQKTLMAQYLNRTASSQNTSRNSSNPEINIDKIIDKLMSGDTSDLETLKKLCTEFSFVRNEHGYSILFTYQGKGYSIVYSDAKDPEQCSINDRKMTTSNYLKKLEELQGNGFGTMSASDTRNNQKISAPDYSNEFDYSNVSDLNSRIADTYDENGIYDDYYKKSMLGSRRSLDVNSGAWDSLLNSLSQVKDQLQQYVKAQMESRGLKYDESFVEQKLNLMITSIASVAIGSNNTNNAYIAGSMEGIFSSYKLDTVQDCVNALIDFTKQYFKAQDSASGTGFSKDNKFRNLKDFFNPDKSEISKSQDPTLENTADFFLSGDEKMLKEALRSVRHTDVKAHTTSDKNEILDYLRVYADHMKKVLKQNYPNLTDDKITSVIDSSNQKVQSHMEPDANGLYDLGSILNNFAMFCEMKAKLLG